MYCPACDLDNQTGAFCKQCGKFLDPSESAPGANEAPTPEQVVDGPNAETETSTPSTETAVEENAVADVPVDAPAPGQGDIAGESPSAPTTTHDAEAPEGLPSEGTPPPTPAPAPAPAPASQKASSDKSKLFSAISALWDFKGTTSRRTYVWFLVFTFFIAIVLAGIRDFPAVHAVISVIYLLAAASMVTRRLRDTGFKLWWLLLWLFPLAGPMAIMTLLGFPSHTRPEKSPGLKITFIALTTILSWFVIIFIIPGLLSTTQM